MAPSVLPELAKAGGELLVQDPDSAVIWGMPGAVANQGIANLVAPPTTIAQHIGDRARNYRMQLTESALRVLSALLEARTGQSACQSDANGGLKSRSRQSCSGTAIEDCDALVNRAWFSRNGSAACR